MDKASIDLTHVTASSNVIKNVTFAAIVSPPLPKITFSPGDYIIDISNNGESIVSLKQDGEVIWANTPDPNAAAKAFGETLRASIQHIAGIDSTARCIIEADLITFLMEVAEQEGPLSAENLKIAFEHICAMRRLRGNE